MKLGHDHADIARWLAEDVPADPPPASAPDWYVRQQRLQRLEDQKMLAGVALSDPDKHVRIVALLKLRDRDVLAEIARLDLEAEVRQAASLCIARLAQQLLDSRVAAPARDT
jgi:hypothetical protein